MKFFITLGVVLVFFYYFIIFSLMAQTKVDQPPFDMSDFDRQYHSKSDLDMQNIIDQDQPTLIEETATKVEESKTDDDEAAEPPSTVVEDFVTQELSIKEKAFLATDNNTLAGALADELRPSIINNPLPDTDGDNPKIVEDVNTQILDVVVSEDRINPNSIQWIEVYVQNKLKHSQPVYVKLEFILPNGRLLNLGKLAVVLPATAVKNIIFRYKIPPRSGGVYVIKPAVYSRKNKLLAVTKKRFEFFVLGELQAFQPGSRFYSQNELDARLASDPKIGFTNIEFQSNYAISTDVIRAEASLKNSGKINLNNISFNIYLVSEQHSFAPLGAALYEEVELALAPGERRIFKFNVLLPDNVNLGNYLLLGVIENNKTPLDFNQLSNVYLSQNVLTVDQIVLDTPIDQIVISKDSMVNFKWRAKDITDFFLQISVDRNFEDPNQEIRIPQESTTNKTSIDSFLVENAITSILKNNYVDTPLYWRVVGADNLGLPVFSKANIIFYTAE